MAIYVPIRKVKEDDVSVEYRFSWSMETNFGLLQVDKRTGEVRVIQALPGDEKNRAFNCAARKVFLHWKEGEFPDETCWAS